MTKYTKVKLGDICRIEKGRTGIASAPPGEYPLVVTAEERKTCGTYQFDCEAVCIPLVSSSGHGKKSLKNVHYQSGKFALGSILCAVIPNNPHEVSARYLHQYLQFYKDTLLVPLMKGAANVSLSMRDIANVEIPLPDFDTQAALAKTFVEAQEKQKQLNAEFEKQTEYAKRLRQNILQEAIEGKLTAEWRKQNPAVKGNPDFDAQALFEQIQKEKEGNAFPCGRTPLRPTPSAGLEVVAGATIKRALNARLENDQPFEIPKGWKWVKLGQLGKLAGGKRLPAGESFSNDKTEHIYIRIKDMKNGSVELKDLKYISNGLAEKLKRYCIYKDEIYITIAGTIGQIGIIPDCLDGMNLTENSAKLRPYIISNLFMSKFLNASFIQNQFSNAVYGMALPKLAMKRIEDVNLPLPPLAEQKEIVAKVESLLTKVSELENQIQERKKLSGQLMQKILKNAFALQK